MAARSGNLRFYPFEDRRATAGAPPPVDYPDSREPGLSCIKLRARRAA
jgi:hypothetical protein